MRIVFEILKQLAKGEGLSGKQIIAKMSPGEQAELSTLTRHIIPKLKPYGVTNPPGIGYHIDPGARRRSAGLARA